jgi:hypothetical protein
LYSIQNAFCDVSNIIHLSTPFLMFFLSTPKTLVASLMFPSD